MHQLFRYGVFVGAGSHKYDRVYATERRPHHRHGRPLWRSVIDNTGDRWNQKFSLWSKKILTTALAFVHIKNQSKAYFIDAEIFWTFQMSNYCIIFAQKNANTLLVLKLFLAKKFDLNSRLTIFWLNKTIKHFFTRPIVFEHKCLQFSSDSITSASSFKPKDWLTSLYVFEFKDLNDGMKNILCAVLSFNYKIHCKYEREIGNLR